MGKTTKGKLDLKIEDFALLEPDRAEFEFEHLPTQLRFHIFNKLPFKYLYSFATTSTTNNSLVDQYLRQTYVNIFRGEFPQNKKDAINQLKFLNYFNANNRVDENTRQRFITLISLPIEMKAKLIRNYLYYQFLDYSPWDVVCHEEGKISISYKLYSDYYDSDFQKLKTRFEKKRKTIFRLSNDKELYPIWGADLQYILFNVTTLIKHNALLITRRLKSELDKLTHERLNGIPSAKCTIM